MSKQPPPMTAERLEQIEQAHKRYRSKPAADGPRYKAVGNSMPTEVMHWLGRRIDLVEKLMGESK